MLYNVKELDRAEELLATLPEATVSPNLLYLSICALRGKHEEPINSTGENIRCSYARESANLDAAFKLAKMNFELTKLFGIQEGNAYPDLIKVLSAQGKKKRR